LFIAAAVATAIAGIVHLYMPLAHPRMLGNAPMATFFLGSGIAQVFWFRQIIIVRTLGLCEIDNENVSLFQAKIIRFINSQIERIEAKEISEGTVCNYVKAIKLFCNMNDIMISWKKSRLSNSALRSLVLTHFHKFIT